MLSAFGRFVATVCCLATIAIINADSMRARGGSVWLNEVEVVKFAAAAGDASPSDQAAAFAKRLAAISDDSPILVGQRLDTIYLCVGKRPVLEVSAAESRMHRLKPLELAFAWAHNINAARALPKLQFGETEISIPVRSDRFASLVGSSAAQSEVRVSNPSVLMVRRCDGGLRIEGLQEGRADVIVTDGQDEEVLGVQIKPWAAQFPQTLSVFVSGAPATEETVSGAVLGALHTQVSALPGSHWISRPVRVSPVGPGSSETYCSTVSVANDAAFPASGKVQVVVKNIGLPQTEDETLWYSNFPESVTRAGPLFSAMLGVDRPVRMLYHHANASWQAMYLRLQAINDSDEAARLLVIPGDSKPDRNPVLAGMRAADQFVRNWMWGSGEVVTIPPHCAIPLSLRRFSPGETVSGLCSLRLVSGPKQIQVRTDAWPPFPMDTRWESALLSSTPWREVGSQPINEYDRAPSEPSEHIFPNPYRYEKIDYHVGGRYGFFRLGQSPIERIDNEQRLDGNFGVIYKLQISLSNPTKEATDVELMFEASAGYAAGLFILDGTFRSTPILSPKREARIGLFHLEPGAVIEVGLTTLPVSGSSYPATLTLRPVEPGSEASSHRATSYKVTDGTHIQNDR